MYATLSPQRPGVVCLTNPCFINIQDALSAYKVIKHNLCELLPHVKISHGVDLVRQLLHFPKFQLHLRLQNCANECVCELSTVFLIHLLLYDVHVVNASILD